MTPILGVLIGVVSALFLVAVIIVVVMRLRGHDDEDDLEKEMEERIGTAGSRQPPNTMSRGVGGPVPSDKSSSLGKDTDLDSNDEKNPDIIPHSTGTRLNAFFMRWMVYLLISCFFFLLSATLFSRALSVVKRFRCFVSNFHRYFLTWRELHGINFFLRTHT
jgi:hypothetical protein